MSFIVSRATLVGRSLAEYARHGLPEVVGPIEREALFIVDGVGGFQFSPLSARRALRELNEPIGTVMYDWQFGLTGEVWTDLMWLRRNRVMAARLARKLLAFRRRYPTAPIHILGYSGGAGIATFACEFLKERPIVDTLILAAAALSPQYNLAPALGAVNRCYALVSERDRGILGLGTTIFGTMDRRHVASAGLRGFHLPPDLTEQQRQAYERLGQIAWSPGLRDFEHFGGHVGWLSLPLLKRHLVPLLRGIPELPVQSTINLK